MDFLAGWASGAMSVITCQPVDTVLTRFQASATSHSSSGIVQQHTKGLVGSFGVKALWRGSSVMISAIPMQNAMLMGGYGIGKQLTTDNDNNKHNALLNVFLGGLTGGIIQSFLMSPIELMKINQQVVGKSIKDAGMELVHGLVKPNQ